MNKGGARSRLDRATFERFCAIAHTQAGIVIAGHKRALVAARVARRQRALGLKTQQDYLAFLEADDTGQELIHYLDTISTNFTGFFREESHFDLLRELVDRWAQEGQQSFTFWSAGASSGEEPYSIGMVLSDLAVVRRFEYRILATDISSAVIARAERAVYRDKDVSLLDEGLRRRHLEPVGALRAEAEGPKMWRVKSRLKESVVFARLNLSDTPYPMSGPFDVIFCRNVMIYFDLELRARILGEIERLLKPGGYLLVGHSESLEGLNSKLSGMGPSIYRKQAVASTKRRGG